MNSTQLIASFVSIFAVSMGIAWQIGVHKMMAWVWFWVTILVILAMIIIQLG